MIWTKVCASTGLALALIGCGIGQGYGGYGGYGSTSSITSSIISGTRRFTGNEYSESWDIDISISVDATGSATGYQYSHLSITGDESWSSTDTDMWFNFNTEGWPSSFEVEARYQGYGDFGTVNVVVTCDDWSHPNGGDTVYSASHEISWE